MQTHADPVKTMQRLEDWITQFSYFKIETAYDSNRQVVSCHLQHSRSSKKASAYCTELYDDGVPDRSTEFHPTVVDVIALALDRWDGLVPQYAEEPS